MVVATVVYLTSFMRGVVGKIVRTSHTAMEETILVLFFSTTTQKTNQLG